MANQSSSEVYSRMKRIIQIESKTFDILPEWNGKEKLLCIIERGRGFQVRIELKERNAGRLCDCLLEAVNLEWNQRLIRSRKEGAKVILFRRLKNSRGRYVLLSLLYEWGKGKAIAIPSGSRMAGWSNFRKDILESGSMNGVPLKENGGRKEVLGLKEQKGHETHLGVAPAIGGVIININGALGIETCYGKNSTMGFWEKVVVFERREEVSDWTRICWRVGDSLKLRKPLIWRRMDKFRCAVILENEEMVKRLVNLKRVNVKEYGLVEVFSWYLAVNAYSEKEGPLGSGAYLSIYGIWDFSGRYGASVGASFRWKTI